MTGINPQIDIANENDFPIFYKIERRFAKTKDGSTPLDNPGSTVEKIDPGRGLFIETEQIKGNLENGKYHEVQVEFEILYGRTEKLEKRFKYRADWLFFLCPQSALLCGPVTTTNDTTLNERIGGIN